jgi:hypothetical protein
MSLKAFHIFFIVLSAALSLGFALWAFKGYADGGNARLALAGAGAILAGIALVVYGIKFLRKLKHVSFL